MGDLHRILQIRPGADDETVAAAYARLRRRYDPALGGPFADESALREVERAYALLSDPEARDAYEMSAQRGAPASADGSMAPGSTATRPAVRSVARDPFALESPKTQMDEASADELPQFKSVDRPPADAETSAGKDIWRAGASSPPVTETTKPPADGEPPSGDKVTHSLGAPPLRHRPAAANATAGRWKPSWKGGYLGPAAAVLVVLGGGLAAWGILQAVGEADDEAAPAESEAPAVEATSGEEPESPAPAVLEAPDVASSEGLPEELADFARQAVEDFEADDGTRYRVYDFVATTTEDGDIFYAAMAIRAESDLVGQAVFFFADDALLGRDWGEDVRSVESIASVSGGQIRVVYRLYAGDDEDCCPSGDSFAVVYSYDGEFGADNAAPPAGIFVD